MKTPAISLLAYKTRTPALALQLLGLAVLLIFGQCSSNSMAEHFNETAADKSSKAKLVLEKIGINPGAKVADIGAGGGYFSYLFSAAVGDTGIVYAVDINPDYLKFIEKNAAQKKITNIKTVQAEANNTNLPNNTVEIAFLRNVYHHLENRSDYFGRLKVKLKAGAKLVIVEYNKNSSFFNKWFGHSTEAAEIQEEMKAAGFKLVANHDVLPKQSFLVFEAN